MLGVGGDGAIGSRFIDLVTMVMNFEHTDLVVIAGEIGGMQEEILAQDMISHPEKYPKPFIGIAKSRLIKRIIKGLDRFGLVTLILPIILMAIILYMLPDYIFWLLVVCVSAWLIINIIKLFKK